MFAELVQVLSNTPRTRQSCRASPSIAAGVAAQIATAQHARRQREPAQDAEDKHHSEAEAAPTEAASSPKDSRGRATGKDAAMAVDVSTGDHGVRHLTCLLEKPTSDLDLEVNRLKGVREATKREKKRQSAQLRNTERKRSRLCTRSKLLSTNNLLEVYAMRVRANTARETKNAAAEG